jgi:hypothetical protein
MLYTDSSTGQTSLSRILVKTIGWFVRRYLLFSFSILAWTSCADEKSQPDVPPPPFDPFEVNLPALEAGNPAEAIIIRWYSALASGDLRTAAGLMHPDDTTALDRRLAHLIPLPRQSMASLENVFCPEASDSLHCLLAYIQRDMLMLDSVLLLRQADSWQVRLFPN